MIVKVAEHQISKSGRVCLKNNTGFGLVELLVAMFILVVIIFAFTPLLVQSIQIITYAGDKTEALYEGQSELEVKMAERETADGTILEFSFEGHPDVVIRVPGDLLYEKIEKGEAEAWISGFIPYMPFIRITNPPAIIEGYYNITATVEGYYTDFSSAGSIEIYTKDNEGKREAVLPYVLNSVFSDPLHKRETAQFSLPNGLVVSNNPYFASVTWDIAVDIPITVESELYIYRPDFFAVGAGQRIWISPGFGFPWTERIYNKVGTGDLTGVVWDGQNTFAAVSRDGRTLVWSLDQEPVVSGSRSELSLNDIAYDANRYVAVGDKGKILAASTESNLLSTELGVFIQEDLDDINAIIPVGGGKFFAVGDNGSVFDINYSAGGALGEEDVVKSQVTFNLDELDELDELENFSFNGVAYDGSSNYYIIVGATEDGLNPVIIKYDYTNQSGSVIEIFENIPALNDIIFDGVRYIAVGDGGTILFSTDCVTWTPQVSGTTKDLYTVDWGIIVDDTNRDYVAAGEDGVIVVYVGGAEGAWGIWTPASTNQNIYGVVLKK